jgi:hypothetical protein
VIKYVSSMLGVKIGLSQWRKRDIRVLGLNRDEVRGDGENYTLRSFIICTHYQMFSCKRHKILRLPKAIEVMRAAGVPCVGQKNVWLRNMKERDYEEELVVEGSTI